MFVFDGLYVLLVALFWILVCLIVCHWFTRGGMFTSEQQQINSVVGMQQSYPLLVAC